MRQANCTTGSHGPTLRSISTQVSMRSQGDGKEQRGKYIKFCHQSIHLLKFGIKVKFKSFHVSFSLQLENENSRLKSQITDLRIKLNQVIVNE